MPPMWNMAANPFIWLATLFPISPRFWAIAATGHSSSEVGTDNSMSPITRAFATTADTTVLTFMVPPFGCLVDESLNGRVDT